MSKYMSKMAQDAPAAEAPKVYDPIAAFWAGGGTAGTLDSPQMRAKWDLSSSMANEILKGNKTWSKAGTDYNPASTFFEQGGKFQMLDSPAYRAKYDLNRTAVDAITKQFHEQNKAKDETKKEGSYKVASYNELTEEGMKITNAAFIDELEKIANKGKLFAKAVKAIKNIAGKGKNLGTKAAKKIDKGVRRVGKKVGKSTKKVTKGKLGSGDLRKKKTQRLLGLGAIGAGGAVAYGTKKAID